MKIVHVVGARPNFVKVAPVMAALAEKKLGDQILLHTGQHYDPTMSEVFFRQLDIPEPDINLDVGSNSHAQQTAQIMMRFEKVVFTHSPDLVLVYGDVNSTVAAALVCAKLLVPVGHVEAGLRSFDRSMPEEINRLLTDQISSLLFTPSKDGNENLINENIAKEKIHFVGNVMIDTLIRLLPRTKDIECFPGIKNERYGVVTLHRPSNVDEVNYLGRIIDVLDDISKELPLIFPIHPRTRKQLTKIGIQPTGNRLKLLDPLGYLDFLSLQYNATVLITDSGGIQEEATYLGIPCLTLRENTERSVTVDVGTNIIIGKDLERLVQEVKKILGGNAKRGKIPDLWDGKAAMRIADILCSL